MLNAIAGHDRRRSRQRARARESDYTRDLDRGLQGLRIGFVRHFHERDMEADREVAAGLEEAARTLKAEGALVRDVTLPSLREITGVQRVDR